MKKETDEMERKVLKYFQSREGEIVRTRDIKENVEISPKQLEYMIEKLQKSKKIEKIAKGKYQLIITFLDPSELTQKEKMERVQQLKKLRQKKEAKKIMDYIYGRSEIGMKNMQKKFGKERVLDEIMNLSVEAELIEQLYESGEERYIIKDLAKTWYSILSQENKVRFGYVFLKVSTLSIKQLERVIEEGITKEMLNEDEKGFYTIT